MISHSLSIEFNRHRAFKAGEGAGKSGSFFFFSHDDRFLIKTVNQREKGIMLKMLDDYVKQVEK